MKPTVLELVTDPRLIRARGDMREYYWAELAGKLARESPRSIAGALFAAQAIRDADNTWFLEHSRALPVLHACVAADAAGVWAELRGYLEGEDAVLFAAGFPEGLLNGLPHNAIVEWVTERADERALVVANLVPKDLRDDGLGAELLSRYPKLLSGVFFSGWVSGSWWGEASEHWETIADRLVSLASTSTRPAVRAWAAWAAAQFRRMATAERKREAEERLRDW